MPASCSLYRRNVLSGHTFYKIFNIVQGSCLTIEHRRPLHLQAASKYWQAIEQQAMLTDRDFYHTLAMWFPNLQFPSFRGEKNQELATLIALHQTTGHLKA